MDNDRKKDRMIFWLIMGLGTAIRIPFLFLPMTYGAGEVWRQADTASIARHFYLNGFNILYPQIYWGGNGPGYVETEFQLYPFIVALLYYLFGEHLWLGKLVSLLFSLGTMYFVYLIARDVLKIGAATWTFGFLAFSPLFVRFSSAFMPEGALLFCFAGGLYFFSSWLEKEENSQLYLASALVGLAILLKATALMIGLVLTPLLINRYGWKAFRSVQVWTAAAICLVPGILWYWHARNLYLDFGNTFGIFSGGDSKFGNMQFWTDPRFYMSLAWLEIQWVFAGAAILLFGTGLYWSVKEKKFLIIAGTTAVIIYFLALARYTGAWWAIHYHLYAVPFGALGIGFAIERLRQKDRYVLRILVPFAFLGAFILGSAFFYTRMVGEEGNRLGRNLIACAVKVAELVPKGDKIVVSTIALSVEEGIPNNFEEPTIFFYADRYGWSLAADMHNPSKLDEYRKEGAKYFVVYNKDLLEANPALKVYLQEWSTQIGPGVESGCGIYRFIQKDAS